MTAVGAPRTPFERVCARVTIDDDESGCWLWVGYVSSPGYGRVRDGHGRKLLAHRVMVEAVTGRPIPDGLTVDHLCGVRRCVNPDHLELVTLAENIRRGQSPSAVAARTNKCQRGHSLEDAYVAPGGKRQCRTCNKARKRARKRRKQT